MFILFRVPLRPLAHGRVRRAAGATGSKTELAYSKDVRIYSKYF